MKKFTVLLSIIIILSLMSGCASDEPEIQVLATTAPVYQFTLRLCQGTDLSVSQLITENVSCLHDYTLQVRQMRDVESAHLLILSGAGMEEFMGDLLRNEKCADCSLDVPLIICGEDHAHEHTHEHEHNHEHDPHIWLSPVNAKIMANNICNALAAQYPQCSETFADNLSELFSELDALHHYGLETLSQLKFRELITFHDGFSYFADCFDLTILEAVEEESGSEASARELKALIQLVADHKLPAIFIEEHGSVSAASVISRETGAAVYTLDMAMGDRDYFEAMYHNIDTIKEALG